MECKEIEKMIPSYFAGQLDEKNLRLFLQHVEKCRECKEELVIQYIVTEGLQRLEEGGDFNIQKELNEKLEQAVNSLKMRKRCKIFIYNAESATILMLLASIFYLMFVL